MKSKSTWSTLFLVISILYFMGPAVAHGQIKGDSKATGKEDVGKQKEKKDSSRTKEEWRKARVSTKENYKKSTGGLKEQSKKKHEVTLENGKVSSTLPTLTEAKNLKQTNREAMKEGGILNKLKRRGTEKESGKILKGEGKGANPAEAKKKRFKKQAAKARYLDSLLHLSDLGNQKEFTSLLQGQLPSWVDQDMINSTKEPGDKLVRVHSDKSLHQVEDTINRYFPARKFLMMAKNKEEISPSDFVGMLGNNKGEKKEGIMGKDTPTDEGGAKSALLKNAKEEGLKDIGSYRLAQEHLAGLKALQVRQVGDLPKVILDSLRKAGMRKNAIKMKEVTQSKTEHINKIKGKGRLRHRLFFEGILGGFNNDFTTFQISPALGFKVFRTFSVGVGPMLTINRVAKRISTTLDLRIFVKKEFFKQRCYLQVEDLMHPYSREKGYSIQQSLYVGAGYILHVGQILNFNVMGLYQVSGPKTGGPFIFRVGLSIIKSESK